MKCQVLIAIAALAAVCLAIPVRDDSPQRGGRIVGGFNATTNQFPYQVSLRTVADFHFCGGSIINNRWILTAAQCTIGRAQNSVRIVVGSILLSSGGTAHVSIRIVNHPSFNAQAFANDVAVIQTAANIVFNTQVQAIGLGTNNVGGNVACVFSGWGSNQVSGGPTTNILQGLNTRTITNADCRSRHTTDNALLIFDHKICTFTVAGEGVCQGDIGGPLVSNNLVIGTLSWMIPCARGIPDIYDRTATFRSWILGVI